MKDYSAIIRYDDTDGIHHETCFVVDTSESRVSAIIQVVSRFEEVYLDNNFDITEVLIYPVEEVIEGEAQSD